MSRSDRDRLHDARAHLTSALDTTARAFDQIWSDRIQRQSLIFDLIVLSEALTKLSPKAKALSEEIPWREVADTRNRLVHAYWRQDRDFYGALLRTSLPTLLPSLDNLIRLISSEPEP